MGLIVRTLMQLAYTRIGMRDQLRLARAVPTPGIVREQNIPFAPGGNPLQMLDVYYKAGTEGKQPTIIDIHGGGWVYGSKDINRNYCRWLAAQGYTVVCPSYRLMPKVELRRQIQDVMAALRWVAANGDAHHCDLSRVFLTGDSAGGHLAGLAYCIEQDENLQRVYKTKPSGLPILALGFSHAVCDFTPTNTAEKLLVKEMYPLMFGDTPTRAPWYGHASFPETSAGIPKLPPIFIVTSDHDPFHKESLILETYLRGRGADYEYICWKREQGVKLGHVFHVKYERYPESIETNCRMLEYFEEAAIKAGLPARDEAKSCAERRKIRPPVSIETGREMLA